MKGRDSFVPIYSFIKDFFQLWWNKAVQHFWFKCSCVCKEETNAHREMRKSLSQDWWMIETEREMVRRRETVGTRASLFLAFTLSTCGENSLTKLYFTLDTHIIKPENIFHKTDTLLRENEKSCSLTKKRCFFASIFFHSTLNSA